MILSDEMKNTLETAQRKSQTLKPLREALISAEGELGRVKANVQYLILKGKNPADETKRLGDKISETELRIKSLKDEVRSLFSSVVEQARQNVSSVFQREALPARVALKSALSSAIPHLRKLKESGGLTLAEQDLILRTRQNISRELEEPSTWFAVPSPNEFPAALPGIAREISMRGDLIEILEYLVAQIA